MSGLFTQSLMLPNQAVHPSERNQRALEPMGQNVREMESLVQEFYKLFHYHYYYYFIYSCLGEIINLLYVTVSLHPTDLLAYKSLD